MIVEYTDEYKDEVVSLVKDFYDEALNDYGITMDYKAVEESILQLKGNFFLLIVDSKCTGILGGKEVITPISYERVWHEVVWYIKQDSRKYGVLLLRKAKEILKDRGIKSIVMVAMKNSMADKLDRFYKRMGLVPMETHYIGEL